jgi:hypothetical protein
LDFDDIAGLIKARIAAIEARVAEAAAAVAHLSDKALGLARHGAVRRAAVSVRLPQVGARWWAKRGTG